MKSNIAFLSKSPSLETISLKMSPKEWWVERKYWSWHSARSCLSPKGSHPNSPCSVREPPYKHIYCIRCFRNTLSEDGCGSIKISVHFIWNTRAWKKISTSLMISVAPLPYLLEWTCIMLDLGIEFLALDWIMFYSNDAEYNATLKLIGESLCESHMSVIALCTWVCMFACLWPYTINF